MPNFAESGEYKELLNISKQHLDALDPTRVREDAIIGLDNYATLMVSTVFAAISIEAALNDYILIHCLLLNAPYLQEVFKDITENYLRVSVQQKIDFVRDHWTDEFPKELLEDVRKLFRIRNRITHQTSNLLTANDVDDGNAAMQKLKLTNDDMQHMLRHHEIASNFLSRFWLPGERQLRSIRR